MNKTLFMAAVVSMTVACRRGGPYHNFDKWKTLPILWDAPLKGHPREVLEREYPAADSARPDLKRFLSRKFHFDDDGNLVREDNFMDDKLVYWSIWRYDQDGPQEITTAADGKYSGRTVSKSIGEGRYKFITYRSHGPGGVQAQGVRIIIFPSSGKEQIDEIYNEDTIATGKPHGLLHVYYDGGRVMKRISTTKDGTVEEHYFYSRWDSPDSIETFAGRKLTERAIFVVNQQGDAARRMVISEGDTSGESYQYEYDSHGNWTKQIETPLRKDTSLGVLSGGASVRERVFVY
ncbi:MAG TPA: hypothetical protein VGS79_15025 [Puia sp.]|nr:hypothetical protein [Puia sp.]